MPIRLARVATAVVGTAVAAVLVTGCGGSSTAKTDSTPTVSPSAVGTAPADTAAATADIKRNWAAFFDSKNKDPKRLDLLQDGAALKAAGAIKDDPNPKPLAAQVTSVSFTSATTAKVVYDLLQNDTPLLPGATGDAVYVDGMWKVSKMTFCQLLALGNAGKPVTGCA